MDFTSSSCYSTLPKSFVGDHAYFYKYDSYDLSPMLDLDGKWMDSKLISGPAYQVVYYQDWTGTTSGMTTISEEKSDPPNQLKYRTPPADKTVLTWCNSHVVTGGADRCPMVLASGTAKTIPYKQMVRNNWNVENAR